MSFQISKLKVRSKLRGIEPGAIKLDGIQIPSNFWEFVAGILITSLGLSLGYALAASVLRGLDCEVYRPHFYWNTVFPHFRVDTEDARMGGRRCEIGVALMRAAPLFFLTGILTFGYPNFEYVLLLGLFYISDPFFKSPVVTLLAAQYREIRLSTLEDFLFVQNKLFWTILNAKSKFADRKYLLIYGFYTLGWLFVIFYSNILIFHLNAISLVSELIYSTGFRITSLVLLIIISGLIIVSGFVCLWIVMKNVARLIHTVYLRKKSTFKGTELSNITSEKTIEILSKSHLFKDCEHELLLKIAQTATTSTVSPRTYIIEEGETGDSLFAILSGKVEVIKELASGRTEKIAELTEGDVFGEIALLQNVPRTRSVRAVSNTTLLTLSREDFESFVVPTLGAEKIKEVIQKYAFLARIPLCQNWHPQALQRFAALSAIQASSLNEFVVRSGYSNQFLHIVYEGSFNVVKDGKEIAKLEIGDIFGEISLLQNTVSVADVISAEESRSLSIHKENFLRFIGHDFFVGLQFERISSERLKHPVFPVQERLFESVSAH